MPSTPRRGRPSKDAHLNHLINLMVLLASAPNGKMPAEQAAKRLGVGKRELEQLVYELSTLSVQDTGARVPVLLEDGELAYAGTGCPVAPARLTADEALALSCALSSLEIEPELASKIAGALFPVDECEQERGERAPRRDGSSRVSLPSQLVASAAPRGSLYARIAEACDVGIRCVIRYRKPGDQAARDRVVDPLSLAEERGCIYLLAWDTSADGERRFRLDRIEDLRFTEESAERHAGGGTSIRQSLGAEGERVALHVDDPAQAAGLPWAGVAHVRKQADEPGAEVIVNVTDRRWLYRRVLASGGSIEIESPEDVRRGLAPFAEELLADQRRSCAFRQSSR